MVPIIKLAARVFISGIILILLIPSLSTLPDPGIGSGKAAGTSTWYQACDIDNITGTGGDSTQVGTLGIELELVAGHREDDFKDASGISFMDNVYLDNKSDEVRLAKIIRNYGSYGDDFGRSVQQTSDGGFIIAGYTDEFNSGNRDVWLIKTDSSGELSWDSKYGGTDWDIGSSVQQTTDGGFIIAGYTESYGAGSADLWLIKTDSLGNVVWDKTYGGALWDSGNFVQQTNDGGYIVTGITYTNSSGESDVWLVKVDSNGNLDWEKRFGGTQHDKGYCVRQTFFPGYIITGYTRSFSLGETDAWLIKTDGSGNHQWNRTYGGFDFDNAYSVSQTSDNGFIITGDTWSYGAGRSDMWLIKTDGTGAEQWNRTYGGSLEDYAETLVITSDNSYVIAGYTNSFSNDNYDIWFIKTDSSGTMVWENIFAGDPSDFASSISITADGGFIMTGHTNMADKAYWDVLLIKANSDGKLSENEGVLTSSNLIENRIIRSITSFRCTTWIQTYSILKIQFSDDLIDWFDSNGELDEWDFLTSGTNVIDLRPLGLKKSFFYYRITFISIDVHVPSLSYVNLSYSLYPEFSNFTSSKYNNGFGANWLKLTWQGSTPPGTQLGFQLRTAEAETDLPNQKFIGPYGSSLLYYNSTPSNIWTGQNRGGWMQFLLVLSSSGRETPILHNVTIEYNSLPEAEVDIVSFKDRWFNSSTPRFQWTFADKDGSQSGYQVQIARSWNFSDIDYDSGELSGSDEFWQFTSGTTNTGISDGNWWYFRIRVRDDQNDWGPFTQPVWLNIDTKPPEFTPFDWARDDWLSNSQPEIYFYAFDFPSMVNYTMVKIDDGNYSVQTTPYTPPPMSDGIHTVTIRSYDHARNFNESSVKIKIDTAPPSIKHDPVTAGTAGEDLIIRAEVTDTFSGVNNVTLYYKNKNDNYFKSISMNDNGDIYSARIPGDIVTTNLVYYIMVSDLAVQPNTGYLNAYGETSVRPRTGNSINIEIKEGKSSAPISSALLIIVFIIVLAVTVSIAWVFYLKRSSAEKVSVPELPESAEGKIGRPLPTFKRPASKKVDGPMPPVKSKQFFKDQPSFPSASHLTHLLKDKTALVRFKCEYCGKSSIVHVSKEFHSVICPHCDEETDIGPGKANK